MAPKPNVGFEILHKIWLSRAYGSFSALWSNLLEQTGVKRHSEWLGEKLSPGQQKTRSQLGKGNRAELCFISTPGSSSVLCTAQQVFSEDLLRTYLWKSSQSSALQLGEKPPSAPYSPLQWSSNLKATSDVLFVIPCSLGREPTQAEELKQLLRKLRLVPIFLPHRKGFVEIVQVTSELFKAFCIKSTDTALRRLCF